MTILNLQSWKKNRIVICCLLLGLLLLLVFAPAKPAFAADEDEQYTYYTADDGSVVKRPINNDAEKDHSTDSSSRTPRPNSNDADTIMITLKNLEQGKVDLANIDMRESASAKSVYVEKAAMEYAAAHDMEIGMITNYVTVHLPAAAIVNSEYWTRAGYSSRSFHFFMNVDDGKGLDLDREYRTSEQIRLKAWPVSQQGVKLEMYIRGSNNNITYINKLDGDVVSLTYNYITNYRTVNSRYPQQTLALLWLDTERRLMSMYTTNDLLETHTDVDAHTVEVISPYAFGSYLLVSETNVDNRKTQLAARPNAGKVNTEGVPAWAAADVGALQSVSVLPENLSGVKFNQPISRAEFAAYLVNALTLPYDGKALANPFNDIPAGHPYYEEILLAYQNGLLSGQTADTFGPDAAITRQEMASLFTRAMAYAGYAYAADLSRLAAAPDAGQIAAWARESAAACLSAGIIAGTDGGRFAPAQTTSWVEAVVMLNRFYQLIH